MEIPLTPDQEAHLRQMAQHQGKEVGQLVMDAVLNFANDHDRIRETLRERIQEADRGVFIEEEEMDTRFQRMIRS